VNRFYTGKDGYYRDERVLEIWRCETLVQDYEIMPEKNAVIAEMERSTTYHLRK
jgi:hypothetical protein